MSTSSPSCTQSSINIQYRSQQYFQNLKNTFSTLISAITTHNFIILFNSQLSQAVWSFLSSSCSLLTTLYVQLVLNK